MADVTGILRGQAKSPPRAEALKNDSRKARGVSFKAEPPAVAPVTTTTTDEEEEPAEIEDIEGHPRQGRRRPSVNYSLPPPEDQMEAAMAQVLRRPQRLRGISFKHEYQADQEAERQGRVRRGRARGPSMIHDPTKHGMVPPKRREDKNKLTVVLDLDETLMYARDGPLYARPYLDEFLLFLGTCCEVIVWTAGVKHYAKAVIREIDPYGVISHCIYRHWKWFDAADYTKELAVMGRDLDSTLIIENTPTCVEKNYLNGVILQDYEGAGHEKDTHLLLLKEFIKQLIASRKTVPVFIQSCPMLELVNLDGVWCFFLKASSLEAKIVRPNQDKAAPNNNDGSKGTTTKGFVLDKGEKESPTLGGAAAGAAGKRDSTVGLPPTHFTR